MCFVGCYHIRIYNKNKTTTQDKLLRNILRHLKDHFFKFVAMEESNMFSQKDMRSMPHTCVWSISYAVFLYLTERFSSQTNTARAKKEN